MYLLLFLILFLSLFWCAKEDASEILQTNYCVGLRDAYTIGLYYGGHEIGITADNVDSHVIRYVTPIFKSCVSQKRWDIDMDGMIPDGVSSFNAFYCGWYSEGQWRYWELYNKLIKEYWNETTKMYLEALKKNAPEWTNPDEIKLVNYGENDYINTYEKCIENEYWKQETSTLILNY